MPLPYLHDNAVTRNGTELKMDQRIEAFLADVLALEGETPDTIREAVRDGLADCEAAGG